MITWPMIEDFLWAIRRCEKIAWLVLWHRPLMRCPICKGAGGATSGYYEPEWCECSTCWDYWNDLEDCGMEWFVGRAPIWIWLRARLSIACGMWYAVRIRDLVRCRVGLHRWMNEDEMEPGLRVCCVCYEHKHDGKCDK